MLHSILPDFLYEAYNIISQTVISTHDDLYYYKTLGLCLFVCLYVPNRLENHLIKLDVLWHKVSLST